MPRAPLPPQCPASREPRFLPWALAMPAVTLGAFFLARECLPAAPSPLLAAAVPAFAAVLAAQAVIALFAWRHWPQLIASTDVPHSPGPGAPGALSGGERSRSENFGKGESSGSGSHGYASSAPAEPVAER